VVGGTKKEFGTVLIAAGVHRPDFSIIAIEQDCSIDSSIIDSTIAKEHDCSIDSSIIDSTIAIELVVADRLDSLSFRDPEAQ
jgi:hypothetical protein